MPWSVLVDTTHPSASVFDRRISTVWGYHNRNHPTIPGNLVDTGGKSYELSLGTKNENNFFSGLFSGIQELIEANTSNVYFSSILLQKVLPQRASLIESLEGNVLSIDITELDTTTARLSVSMDKAVGFSFFVKRLSELNIEEGLLLAGDDEDGGTSKNRFVDIPLQTGRYRVIVRIGERKYYRDYLNLSAISAVSVYGNPTDNYIKDDYPQGVTDGRRAFAEAIYPLGNSYGFDSSSVLAGPNWDTNVTRNNFVSTIADTSSINTSKIFLNALVARGASPYNGSITLPSYYTGLANSAAQEVLNAGGVASYKSVYNSYPPFIYDSSSNDGTYLDSIKNSFINTILTDGQNSGYNTAYNEFYSIINSQISMPLGYSAWDTARPKNFTEAQNAIRFTYNAGAIRASQLIYDEGLLYGFDFRNLTTTTQPLDNNTSRTQYENIKDDFRIKLQSSGKIEGLQHFLSFIRTQYGFNYDWNNTANLSDEDYATYLQGLRNSALGTISEEDKKSVYLDFYNFAQTNFQFTGFNSTQTSTQLASAMTSMFREVFSYGFVAASQEIYDRGNATYFPTLTNYNSIRNGTITTNNTFLTTAATNIRNLQADYYIRVYEFGAIFTYRRLYDLGIPYGFTYNSSELLASYYSGLETNYINTLTLNINELGRKGFASDIYPLADIYGFNSAAVLAGPDWDTNTTRQLFVDTIYQAAIPPIPTIGQVFPRGDKR